MTSALARCPDCDASIEVALDRCLTCAADIGAPNVREATSAAETSALDERYRAAVSRAISRGAQVNLVAFERALERSGVVVNCTLPFLRNFLTESKTLYVNYHRTVQAGARKTALPEHDQERTVVDAIMFRSYASSICFGALSLNARGLTSYGPYGLRLRPIAISRRASLLEENSFWFVEHHSLGAKTPIPPGFRSDWTNRSRLAVAKLEASLDVGIQKQGFAKLLLCSTGDYKTDEFMEVHIFGTFDFNAVECISGPLPKKAMDIAIWEAVKEDATLAGKLVDEW